MTTDDIRKAVAIVAANYPIKRVWLFGSRATNSFTEDSDVDLIVEFSAPVTLITLAQIAEQLEDMLHKDVDLIHGPLRDSDLIEVNEKIEIYAA